MIREPLYYQQNLVEENIRQTQLIPPIYTVESEEGNEGGLNLGELLTVIRRRLFVIFIGTTIFASAAVGLALTKTTTYVAKFELLTEPVTPEDKVAPNNGHQIDENSNKIDETKVRILQSPKLMSHITQEVQKHYPGSTTPQLNIKLLPKTQILEVSYQDSNPEKVLFVLNKASEAYLKYSLEERQTDTNLAIQFVEKQLPQLLQRVEILQSKLQGFRQKYGIINAEVQSQQLASQLDQIVQKRLDTETQLTRTQAFYISVQKQLNLKVDEAEAVLAISESPGYQKLLAQFQDVEAQIATKSSQFTDNNPSIQNLLIQKQNLLDLMDKERRRILGNKFSNITIDSPSAFAPNSARVREIQKFIDADKQIQVLKTQLQFLNKVESNLRKQVQQFPSIIRQKDDLERQLKITVDNLNHFLSERERLRIDSAQKQVPWQVIAPPNKPQNVAPSIKLSLVLGTILGLLLSTGCALMVDKINNVFNTIGEFKKQTKLLILGELYQIKVENNYRLFQKQKIGHFWESLYSIYTKICLFNNDNTIRSLAIISSARGDGKSTIALYLAQVAAAMGKRVLLVDANLRNPVIHTVLDLPNTQGLSNLITERLDFENVIHKSSSYIKQQNYSSHKANSWDVNELLLEQNLFILTSGQITANPTMLFSSSKIQNLAEQFKQNFDLVIYDTANLLDFADTYLLTRYTDASILALGIGKTNRSVLAQVLEQLNLSSAPILGAIAINYLRGIQN